MKTKLIKKGWLLILFIQVISLACQNNGENTVVSEQESLSSYKIDFVPAKTNAELEMLRTQSNNMIKSREQLNQILLNKSTALSDIDPILQKDFIDGLVFRDGIGIVGIKFNTLKANVDTNSYNKIMALFGIDTAGGFWDGAGSSPTGRTAATAEDYKGYFCQNPGTCYRDACCICLSGC